MKLKYYLRGMGIGIILTAIVMGFALGGRKTAMSDAEIITRAKALGMVEAGQGVLSDTNGKESSKNENDTPASGEALDQKGEEVSEKVNETVSSTDSSIFEVAQSQEEAAEPIKEDSTASDNSKSSEANEASTIIETKIPEINEASVGEDVDSDAASDSDSETASADNETASAGNQNDEPVSRQTAAASNTDTEPNTQSAKSDTDAVKNTNNSETDASETNSSTTNTDTAQNTQTASSQQKPETPKVQGKTVVIPGGSDSDRVAAILYNEGFVESSAGFNNYLVESGQDRKIRSGTKVIPEGATYEQIAAIITSG